jgi:ferredoxin
MAEESENVNPGGLPGSAVIDRQSCMGSGNCAYWAPDVFDLDEEGIAIVIGDLDRHGDQVRLAAENCPTAAIHLDQSVRNEQ